MKKLFALISLLGLVVGMGGMLNAQEASDDTQNKLDTIILYGKFKQPGEAQTVKFKFSATPGEKFIIEWYWGKSDTIFVATTDEMEATYTFSGDKTTSKTFAIVFSALAPTGHIKSPRIDSAYKYTGLTFKNCMLLDTIQVVHNTLENLNIMNCPTLKFLDISHNKLHGWYQEMTSALTYLDCSHNDILDIVETGFTSLETLDCSYNHRLRQLRLSDCKALVNLRAIHNDSIRYYGFDLPQNSPLQSLSLGHTHQLQELDLSQCPNLTTLNCYGNSQLTSLNLSNNPKLETLNCFDNEKLTSLYINQTSWDSLDISSMPSLEYLDCSHNQLISITFNNHSALTTINCDYNKLDYIDLSQCKNLQDLYISNNRFSTLEIPDNMILRNLYCDSNHIPLSILVDLIRHYHGGWDTNRQFLTLAPLQVGHLLDLRSETKFSDCYHCEQYTILLDGKQVESRYSDGAEDHDYGLFTFNKTGNYRLCLRSYLYSDDGHYFDMYADYDLTVVDSVVRPQFSIPSGAVLPDTALVLSTPTPDARIYYTTDGSEPDENALLYQDPIRITEAMTVKAVAIQDTFKSHIAIATYTIDSVANEYDLRASKLRIYAKDRTIYLSEAVGEVEVFTMDGHCVYRGHDTAIPFKQIGIYIVSAAGRRWKVAVR